MKLSMIGRIGELKKKFNRQNFKEKDNFDFSKSKGAIGGKLLGAEGVVLCCFM